MDKRIWTVLRSGGEYNPAHVIALERSLHRWHPDAALHVITDREGLDGLCMIDDSWIERSYTVYNPKRLWPGWWLKCHLFGDWTDRESLLYMDLDTRIVGPMDEIFALANSLPARDIVLRDFYRGGRTIGSGFMLLSNACRALLWDKWLADPEGWIQRLGHRGDQGFLESVFSEIPDHLERWQDVVPGKVLSFKVDIRDKRLTSAAGASVVAFHGRPRPWSVVEPHHKAWIDGE